MSKVPSTSDDAGVAFASLDAAVERVVAFGAGVFRFTWTDGCFRVRDDVVFRLREGVVFRLRDGVVFRARDRRVVA